MTSTVNATSAVKPTSNAAHVDIPPNPPTSSAGRNSSTKIAFAVLIAAACGFGLVGGAFGAGYIVGHTNAAVRDYIGSVHLDGENGEHLHGKAIQHEMERVRAFSESGKDIRVFKEKVSFTFGFASDSARRRLNALGDATTGQQMGATVALEILEDAMKARGIHTFLPTAGANINVTVGADTPLQVVLVKLEPTMQDLFYLCGGADCHELQAVKDPAPASNTDAHRRQLVVLGFWATMFVNVMTVVTTDAIHGGCLPADALVTAMVSVDAPPVVMPIAQVPFGAMVLSTAGFSPIYLYSHFTEKALTPMTRIETVSGHVVELTAHHYLRACNVKSEQCAFTTAINVAEGMSVELLATNGSTVKSTVTATSTVEKKGLFNPHTLTGDIVVANAKAPGDIDEPDGTVQGIVVSDASEWFAEGYVPEAYIPTLYHAVLSPVRQLFRLNPEWLARFHERTIKLLEMQADDARAQNVRSRAVAGSLDMLGAYEIAKSAAITGLLGLFTTK